MKSLIRQEVPKMKHPRIDRRMDTTKSIISPLYNENFLSGKYKCAWQGSNLLIVR